MKLPQLLHSQPTGLSFCASVAAYIRSTASWLPRGFNILDVSDLEAFDRADAEVSVALLRGRLFELGPAVSVSGTAETDVEEGRSEPQASQHR